MPEITEPNASDLLVSLSPIDGDTEQSQECSALLKQEAQLIEAIEQLGGSIKTQLPGQSGSIFSVSADRVKIESLTTKFPNLLVEDDQPLMFF